MALMGHRRIRPAEVESASFEGSEADSGWPYVNIAVTISLTHQIEYNQTDRAAFLFGGSAVAKVNILAQCFVIVNFS